MKIVLIAEDNELLANLWSRALSSEEIEVRVARNGEEVVKLAAETHPDLILMDIMMPKMDGLEAARRIRSGKDTPPDVIFVSCVARLADIEEANSLKALDFLVKGRFSINQLVARVSNVLGAPEAA